MTSVVKGLVRVGAVGAGCLAYAGLYEVNAFRLRRVTVPVLPPGARPIRVLHVSDVHMTPYARARQRWLSTLGALEPDLVINTGDNLAHQLGWAAMVRSPLPADSGSMGVSIPSEAGLTAIGLDI